MAVYQFVIRTGEQRSFRMTKRILYILFASLFTLSNLPAGQSAPSEKNSGATREKDKIMLRDQVDSTDTFAIPLDESEVEDEAQINRDEKKNLFNLPSSSNKK